MRSSAKNLLTKTNIDLHTIMGRFQIEEIKKQMASDKVTSDFYVLQNLEWSSYYLFAFIHTSLHGKILYKILVNYTTPEVVSAIIASSVTHSYDSIENHKHKLKNTKLSIFPDEMTYSILFVRSIRLSAVKNFAYGFAPILLPRLKLTSETAIYML